MSHRTPLVRPRRRGATDPSGPPGPGALVILVVLATVVVTACGGADQPTTAGPTADPGTASPATAGVSDPGDWETVVERARGQTVRWWMFGGDELVNTYVDQVVTPAAEELGVTIERVPVDDTAAAVQRVLAEKRAGRTQGGSVDLIWLNGENFAQGKQADVWLKDWARDLPNSNYVDWSDPTINSDFGVPVDGQESPWSRAAFVFAHDQARTPDPPSSFEELLAYAEEHPGKVAYPAPPNFTGSAFVRLAVQALGEDEAFQLLGKLKPLQWREGQAFPENAAELNRLFGNGVVDFAMSYDPAFVQANVDDGTFPGTARPFTLDAGTLQNTSYVTTPANAANRAGALVVANLLLEPRLQANKADPEGLTVPTVLDLDTLSQEQRQLFREAAKGPYILVDFGKVLTELPADQVPALEERWQREVLRSSQSGS